MISYRDASRKRGELLTLDLYLFNNIGLAECCCCCCGANCPNFREYPALHCQLCRSSPHSHFFIASSLSLLPKQRSRFPQSCLPVLTSQSKGVSAELHELLLRKLSCGEPKSADRKLLQQWKSKKYLLWSQKSLHLCDKIFMASMADSWENHLLNGFYVTGISWCGQKIKADKYLSAVNERYKSVHRSSWPPPSPMKRNSDQRISAKLVWQRIVYLNLALSPPSCDI